MSIGGRLGLYTRLITMFRFLLDKKVSFRRKIPILAWLLYFISPVDLLPDPVLGFGIIDDAVLLGFIITYIGKRLDDYCEERKGGQDKAGDRVITDVDYEVHDENESSG
ncbi:MAG: DUF1232 domain-containing protein [Bacillota bacterium]|nr:DUF1232 domain-containing protein [Bacillota bacterium]